MTIFHAAGKHIRDNLIYYSVIAALFVCGGIVAAVTAFSMTDLANKELMLYLNDFFTTLNKTSSDGFSVFQMSVMKNLTDFGILFLFSVMVIGTPFIAVYCGIKGFVSFFTILFLFKVYGIKAALFFFVGMLPHMLIMLPCFALLTICGMKFSISLTNAREKTDLKANFIRFLITISILFLVSVMSSLLQAYIEPLFMKLISGYFI